MRGSVLLGGAGPGEMCSLHRPHSPWKRKCSASSFVSLRAVLAESHHSKGLLESADAETPHKGGSLGSLSLTLVYKLTQFRQRGSVLCLCVGKQGRALGRWVRVHQTEGRESEETQVTPLGDKVVQN